VLTLVGKDATGVQFGTTAARTLPSNQLESS
jgi:hypothetical protein